MPYNQQRGGGGYDSVLLHGKQQAAIIAKLLSIPTSKIVHKSNLVPGMIEDDTRGFISKLLNVSSPLPTSGMEAFFYYGIPNFAASLFLVFL